MMDQQDNSAVFLKSLDLSLLFENDHSNMHPSGRHRRNAIAQCTRIFRLICFLGIAFTGVFGLVLHAILPSVPRSDLKAQVKDEVLVQENDHGSTSSKASDSLKIDREAELKAMNCSFMPEYEYINNTKAMWIPAFQGSGNYMVRSLVTAITGLGGDGVYQGCFEYDNKYTATCKTHWPMYPLTYPPSHYRNVTSRRVIMLLRNPKDSLPSSFNYNWEKDRNVRSHTVQAPQKDWNAWRDHTGMRYYDEFWMGLILTWKQRSDYDVAFYIPYERLVNIETGPQLLSRLAAELRSNGVRVAAEEDLPCLWYKVVKEGKKSDLVTQKQTKRAPHRYVPSFTLQQQIKILGSLEFLQHRFSDDLELGDILSKYHDDIQKNMRIQDDLVGDEAEE